MISGFKIKRKRRIELSGKGGRQISCSKAFEKSESKGEPYKKRINTVATQPRLG